MLFLIIQDRTGVCFFNQTYMPKKIIAFFLFSFYLSAGYTQPAKVKVVGKIFYNVSHLWDTIAGKRLNELAVLYFGTNDALYRSYDALLGQEAIKKWQENGSIGSRPLPGRGSRDLYYTSLSAGKIQRVRNFINPNSASFTTNYVMPEPVEKTAWKIETETKKIGNYLCQKATAFSRGRLYTVWFCNDIPYAFGPWKLTGLPGLIMEAADSRGQVMFQFNRIEFPVKTTEYIEPVEHPVMTTESGFEKMRQAFYAAEPANSGISAVLLDAQGKPVKSKGPPLMNNPMDLVSRYPLMY